MKLCIESTNIPVATLRANNNNKPGHFSVENGSMNLVKIKMHMHAMNKHNIKLVTSKDNFKPLKALGKTRTRTKILYPNKIFKIIEINDITTRANCV